MSERAQPLLTTVAGQFGLVPSHPVNGLSADAAWLMKSAFFDMAPLAALGASPLRGARLSCFASSPFLRRGLDPAGLPSFAQHGQAGCAGGLTKAALPAAGDRGP